MRADDNDELHAILRDFLEPDTNDKKIHGGAVIRTVNIILFTYLYFNAEVFLLLFSFGSQTNSNDQNKRQDESHEAVNIDLIKMLKAFFYSLDDLNSIQFYLNAKYVQSISHYFHLCKN